MVVASKHRLPTPVNDGIEMHYLIELMGKNTVTEKYIDKPGRHSRLWIVEDAFDVLTNQTGSRSYGKDAATSMVLEPYYTEAHFSGDALAGG
ncbi:hypothetical protein MLD38_031424 [Melastoma candidum]|uniref:Uncharacterized protein n=1 Tax=Melastoma candidum TaxID=119954 RepID=A0ACB9MRJ0_9MYRT|nr:hypothetical protein MLD38_031424 [Melastoma candidum]